MDLNAVEMFVNVVQTGSLSAAAQRLGIPLPTLSRKMRELEQQLSVQLLERTTRGTQLTDAGTRLYEHASRGIESLVDAREAVLSSQAQLKGYLRLSLPPSFEPWWAVLDGLIAECPVLRSPTSFEFIAGGDQIADIRRFLADLARMLSSPGA